MIYYNYDQANKPRGQTGRAATMKYLSVPQTAERWGISSRRIQILCNEERIPGAVKIGNRWAIPDDLPSEDWGERQKGRVAYICGFK